MSEFGKIAILGPGLLGGSIALAIRKHLPDTELALWGRREESTLEGKALGISGATSDLTEAVSAADLIILATPVGVMPGLVSQLHLDAELLVTDVGSVKRSVHENLRPYFKEKNAQFIGSHPMAGSEKTGLSAAREDLLDGAACILTNDEQADQASLKKLEAFWQSLGMQTRQLSAEDHDYAVARISHFPHLLASIGAKVGLAFEDIAHLSGGGLRDTTRVAAGDPTLWTEIIMENADALQRSVAECIEELNHVQTVLQTKQRDALFDYLESAKQKRNLI